MQFSLSYWCAGRIGDKAGPELLNLVMLWLVMIEL